jgi:fructokinase
MILVCGEALYDLFVAGEDGFRISLAGAPGGSPFNVAVGLARLDRRVGFFGGLSTDLFGERLAAALLREGVDLACAVRRAAPTTVAFVEIGPDGAARYVFHGEGAADRTLGFDDLPELAPETRALAFGSFSTVVAPCGDALLALARREAFDRVIAYDPNVRPTVEPDLDRWRARFDEFAQVAGLLKLSEDDLAALAPEADSDAFAEAALAGGAQLVVVTRGAEGASAWGGFGRVAVPAQTGAIVDTVGAGDSAMAALLCWLDERGLLARDALGELRRHQAEAALGFAMRAAAATCARRGADPPRRREIG